MLGQHDPGGRSAGRRQQGRNAVGARAPLDARFGGRDPRARPLLSVVPALVCEGEDLSYKLYGVQGGKKDVASVPSDAPLHGPHDVGVVVVVKRVDLRLIGAPPRERGEEPWGQRQHVCQQGQDRLPILGAEGDLCVVQGAVVVGLQRDQHVAAAYIRRCEGGNVVCQRHCDAGPAGVCGHERECQRRPATVSASATLVAANGGSSAPMPAIAGQR